MFAHHQSYEYILESQLLQRNQCKLSDKILRFEQNFRAISRSSNKIFGQCTEIRIKFLDNFQKFDQNFPEVRTKFSDKSSCPKSDRWSHDQLEPGS
jgi:predicted Holliday junction resolvase-like endonuclease